MEDKAFPIAIVNKDGNIVESKIYPPIISEEKYDECRLEMEKFGKKIILKQR